MEHSLGDQDLAQSAGAPGAEGQVVFWLGVACGGLGRCTPGGRAFRQG